MNCIATKHNKILYDLNNIYFSEEYSQVELCAVRNLICICQLYIYIYTQLYLVYICIYRVTLYIYINIYIR